MPYEQRDGSGVLFKNDKKKSDKHPDYTGKITWGGQELRLSAWIKEGRSGKFLSISMQEPQSSGRGGYGRSGYEDDEDIPF